MADAVSRAAGDGIVTETANLLRGYAVAFRIMVLVEASDLLPTAIISVRASCVIEPSDLLLGVGLR